MKGNRKHQFPTLLVVSIVLLSSCELDDFSIDSDDERDKVVDTWRCEETSQLYGELNPYLSDISKEPGDSVTIYINNFYQLGFDQEIYATLTNRNIQIPLQTVDGHKIKGGGFVNNSYNSIRFEYTVDEGSGTLDNVTALYSRN